VAEFDMINEFNIRSFPVTARLIQDNAGDGNTLSENVYGNVCDIMTNRNYSIFGSSKCLAAYSTQSARCMTA
jgi:hypothetical protein